MAQMKKYNIRTVSDDNIQPLLVASEDNILKAVDTACRYYITHELKTAIYINNAVNPVFVADELAKYIIIAEDTILYVLPNMNEVQNILDKFDTVHPGIHKNQLIIYRIPLTDEEIQTLTQYFILTRIDIADNIIPDTTDADDSSYLKFKSKVFFDYDTAVEASKKYDFRTAVVSVTAVNKSEAICTEIVYTSDEDTDIEHLFMLSDDEYKAHTSDKKYTPDDVLNLLSAEKLLKPCCKFILLYKNRQVTNLDIDLFHCIFKLYNHETITSKTISAQKFFRTYLNNHFDDVVFIRQEHNIVL